MIRFGIVQPALTLDPARTAVLAMDCQTGILANYSKSGEAFLDRVAGILNAARAAGSTVIHIQVGFRPGFPEVSPRNKNFSAILANPERRRMFDGPNAAIHPALGPEPGDIVVTKHRVSAFHGTDLEVILRAKDIETLVLFGVATSGVVLSTLTHAADADYRIIVISDCCADLDDNLHNTLLGYFARRGEVLTAAEFQASAFA